MNGNGNTGKRENENQRKSDLSYKKRYVKQESILLVITKGQIKSNNKGLPVVQWLVLQGFIAVGRYGFDLWLGARSLSAMQCGQKMKVTMRLFSTIRLAIIQTLENKCVDKGSIYRFQGRVLLQSCCV